MHISGRRRRANPIGYSVLPPNPIKRAGGGTGRASAPRNGARRRRPTGEKQARNVMDYKTCPSLAAMFFDAASRLGDQPFLWAKHAGTYRPLTWRETAARVSALSRGLRGLGIQHGDRVALISENRPEWLIADFAIVASGAITVPAYTTNTVEDFRHVLSNSGARAAIVSTAALTERVLPAADQITQLESVITIEPLVSGQISHVEMHLWDELLVRGAAMPDDVDTTVRAVGRDDIACLIYTSGTGGVPKGVMTTHANILANCYGAHELLTTFGLGDEVFLSFLPLSHSYEHTAGMMFPVSIGAQIYFAEGADTLAANMLEARPTLMTAVPRLYETLHQRILRGMERQKGLRRALFDRALALGRKRCDDPHGLGLVERLADLMLERLVRDKVRARFGGRLKAMVSGGAPLNPEIGKFFVALGVNLLQGYGQTEASPVIACNPPARIKIDTVGPALAGVEIRIEEDGEVVVRGDLVMKGYWNDPESTSRTVQNGWLHTGDVGELDRDGYLRITDRKRDFIKNSGGDMISPARVEGYLALEPEIAQVMVYGDRRPYLVAVIVPDSDYLVRFARENHRPSRELADLVGDTELHKAVGAAVARVNRALAPLERVRRFVIAGEAFTVANGQMTPTLKVKRHAIRAAYGSALLALYEAKAGGA
jgi:long-chain acyl-CoA synthetase